MKLGKVIDLTGQIYGRLTVIEKLLERNKHGKIMWLCECSCELKTRKPIQASHLKSGMVNSCGCLQKEAHTKHGMCDTRIYSIHRDMKDRCNNPNNDSYHHYGGRGISVFESWMGDEGFKNFYNWAMSNGYEKNLTLDRFDVDKNYEPDNCRWATMKEQQNNKRNNVFVEIEGIKRTLSEWAEVSGIPRVTLVSRINLGWKTEDLLKPQIRKFATKQSGVKGIIWDKRRSKWSITIHKNKKKIQIGSSDTVEEGVEIMNAYFKERE